MLEDSGYVDLEDIQEQPKIPLKITKKKVMIYEKY